MAKLRLTDPVSGGDLAHSITEARLLTVKVDLERDTVLGIVAYGTIIGTRFTQSPLNPPGSSQVILDFEQYPDVAAAWKNFQRKLLKRGSSEGIFPPGDDED